MTIVFVILRFKNNQSDISASYINAIDDLKINTGFRL